MNAFAKRALILTLLVLCLFGITILGASAAETGVAEAGKTDAHVVSATVGDEALYFQSLAEALAQADTGSTVTLLEAVTLDSTVTVSREGATLTLDLGGNTVTSSASIGIALEKGSLTVQNGTIEASGEAFRMGLKTTESAADATILTLANNLTVTSSGDCCVVVYAGTLNSAATLTSNSTTYSAIQGSGLGVSSTVINITGGSITSSTNAAIYHPQAGTLTISGGTITGATAVYVKAGSVEISGGTFVATGAKEAYTVDNDGYQATGDAIVIENADYPAEISGVSITGGTFTSANASAVASYANTTVDPSLTPVAGFVSGGTFTSAEGETMDEAVVAEDSALTDLDGDGVYDVQDAPADGESFVARIGSVGYTSLADAWAAAEAGDTIVLLYTGAVTTSDFAISIDGKAVTVTADAALTRDALATALGAAARIGDAYYSSAKNAYNAVTGGASTNVTIYILKDYNHNYKVGLGNTTGDKSETVFANASITLVGVQIGTDGSGNPIYPTITNNDTNAAFYIYNAADFTLQNINFATAARFYQTMTAGTAEDHTKLTLGENVKIIIDPHLRPTYNGNMNGEDVFNIGHAYFEFTLAATASIEATYDQQGQNQILFLGGGSNAVYHIYGSITVNATNLVEKISDAAKSTSVFGQTAFHTVFMYSTSSISFTTDNSATNAFAFWAYSVVRFPDMEASAALAAAQGYGLYMQFTDANDLTWYSHLKGALANAKDNSTLTVVCDGVVLSGGTVNNKTLTITALPGVTVTSSNFFGTTGLMIQFSGDTNVTFTDITFDIDCYFGRLDGTNVSLTFGDGFKATTSNKVFLYASDGAPQQTSTVTIDFAEGSEINYNVASGNLFYNTGSKDWDADGTKENRIVNATVYVSGKITTTSSSNGIILSCGNDSSTYIVYFDASTAEITAPNAASWFQLSENLSVVYISGVTTADAADAIARRASLAVRSGAVAAENGWVYTGFKGQLHQHAFDLLPEGEDTIYLLEDISSIFATINIRITAKIVSHKADASAATIKFQGDAQRLQVHDGAELTIDGVNLTSNTKTAAAATDNTMGRIFQINGGSLMLKNLTLTALGNNEYAPIRLNSTTKATITIQNSTIIAGKDVFYTASVAVLADISLTNVVTDVDDSLLGMCNTLAGAAITLTIRNCSQLAIAHGVYINNAAGTLAIDIKDSTFTGTNFVYQNGMAQPAADKALKDANGEGSYALTVRAENVTATCAASSGFFLKLESANAIGNVALDIIGTKTGTGASATHSNTINGALAQLNGANNRVQIRATGLKAGGSIYSTVMMNGATNTIDMEFEGIAFSTLANNGRTFNSDHAATHTNLILKIKDSNVTAGDKTTYSNEINSKQIGFLLRGFKNVTIELTGLIATNTTKHAGSFIDVQTPTADHELEGVSLTLTDVLAVDHSNFISNNALACNVSATLTNVTVQTNNFLALASGATQTLTVTAANSTFVRDSASVALDGTYARTVSSITLTGVANPDRVAELALTFKARIVDTTAAAVVYYPLNQALVDLATENATKQGTIYIAGNITQAGKITLGDGKDIYYEDKNGDGKQQTATEPNLKDTNFKIYDLIIVGVAKSDGKYPTLTSSGTDHILLYDGSDLEFRNITVTANHRWVRIYNRVNDKDTSILTFGENATALLNTTNSGAEDFIYSQGGSYASFIVAETAAIRMTQTAASSRKSVLAFNNSYGDVIIRGTIEASLTGATGCTGNFILFVMGSYSGYLYIESSANITFNTAGAYGKALFTDSANAAVIHANAKINGAALTDTTAKAIGFNVRNNAADGTLSFYTNNIGKPSYTWMSDVSTFTLLGNAGVVIYEKIVGKDFTITSLEGNKFTLTLTGGYGAFCLGMNTKLTLTNMTLELGTPDGSNPRRFARIDGDTEVIFGNGCTVNCAAAIFIYNNGNNEDAQTTNAIFRFEKGSIINWTSTSGSLIYENLGRDWKGDGTADEKTVMDASVYFSGTLNIDSTSNGALVSDSNANSAYFVYIDLTSAVIDCAATKWFNFSDRCALSLKGYESLDAALAYATTHGGTAPGIRSGDGNSTTGWVSFSCFDKQINEAAILTMPADEDTIYLLRDIPTIWGTMHFRDREVIKIVGAKADGKTAVLNFQGDAQRMVIYEGTELIFDGVTLNANTKTAAAATDNTYGRMFKINGGKLTLKNLTLTALGNNQYAPFMIVSATQSVLTIENCTINAGADAFHFEGSAAVFASVILDNSTLNSTADTGFDYRNKNADSVVSFTLKNGTVWNASTGLYATTDTKGTVNFTVQDSDVTSTSTTFLMDGNCAITLNLTVKDSDITITGSDKHFVKADPNTKVKLKVTLTGTKTGTTDANATFTTNITGVSHLFQLTGTAADSIDITATGVKFTTNERVFNIQALAQPAAGKGFTDAEGEGNFAMRVTLENIHATCRYFFLTQTANAKGNVLLTMNGTKTGTGTSAVHSNVINISTGSFLYFAGTSSLVQVRASGVKAVGAAGAQSLVFMNGSEDTLDMEFEGITFDASAHASGRPFSGNHDLALNTLRLVIKDSNVTAGDQSTYSNEIYAGEIAFLIRSFRNIDISITGAILKATSSSAFAIQTPTTAETGVSTSFKLSCTDVASTSKAHFLALNSLVCDADVTLTNVQASCSVLFSVPVGYAHTLDATVVNSSVLKSNTPYNVSGTYEIIGDYATLSGFADQTAADTAALMALNYKVRATANGATDSVYFAALTAAAMNHATANATKAGTLTVLGDITPGAGLTLGDGRDVYYEDKNGDGKQQSATEPTLYDQNFKIYDLTLTGVKLAGATKYPTITYNGELFVLYDGSDLTLSNINIYSNNRWLRVYNRVNLTDPCDIVFGAGTTVSQQTTSSNDDYILVTGVSYANITVEAGATLSRILTDANTEGYKGFFSIFNMKGSLVIAGEIICKYNALINTVKNHETPCYLVYLTEGYADVTIKNGASITWVETGKTANCRPFYNFALPIVIEDNVSVNGTAYQYAWQSAQALDFTAGFVNNATNKLSFNQTLISAINYAKPGTTVTLLKNTAPGNFSTKNTVTITSAPNGPFTVTNGTASTSGIFIVFYHGANITFENIIFNVTNRMFRVDGEADSTTDTIVLTFGQGAKFISNNGIFGYANSNGGKQTTNLTMNLLAGSEVQLTGNAQLFYHNMSLDFDGDGTTEYRTVNVTAYLNGKITSKASIFANRGGKDEPGNAVYKIYVDLSTAEISSTNARWFYLAESDTLDNVVFVKGVETLAEADAFAHRAGLAVRSGAKIGQGVWIPYTGFRGQISNLAIEYLPEGENTLYILKNIDSINGTVHFRNSIRESFYVVGATADGSMPRIGFQGDAYRFQVYDGASLTIDGVELKTSGILSILNGGTTANRTELIFTNGAKVTATISAKSGDNARTGIFSINTDACVNFVLNEGCAINQSGMPTKTNKLATGTDMIYINGGVNAIITIAGTMTKACTGNGTDVPASGLDHYMIRGGGTSTVNITVTETGRMVNSSVGKSAHVLWFRYAMTGTITVAGQLENHATEGTGEMTVIAANNTATIVIEPTARLIMDSVSTNASSCILRVNSDVNIIGGYFEVGNNNYVVNCHL